MEIKEFQAKLSEALGLAVENGKKIHADTVEGIFAGNGLTEGQMQKVYEYLAIQGIQVDGRGPGSAAAGSQTTGAAAGSTVAGGQTGSEALVTTAASIPANNEAIPLTQEETEYLEEYENTLKDIPPEKQGEREILFEKALKQEESAKKRLAELYMTEVVKTARELKHEEIFIGDMIAEGNIGLLTAIEMLHEAGDYHTFLCGEIRNAMLLMVEEQTDQKQRDDILVEKVRDLETKIKELLEDDDVKYSVDELAVFLDMDVEEIQAVLRLTGEDK